MEVLNFITTYVEFRLLVTILLGGFFITKYTKNIKIIDNVYKVLIASIIFSVIFYLMDTCEGDCRIQYMVTYLFATSFYEVFLSKLLDKLGVKNKEKASN